MMETKLYKKRMRIAKRIILSSRNTSTSYLQRKMEISYNDAAMMMSEISKLSGFRFLFRARKKNSNIFLPRVQKSLRGYLSVFLKLTYTEKSIFPVYLPYPLVYISLIYLLNIGTIISL